MVEKWIQKAKPSKGAFHRQLGYKEDEKIPTGVIDRIVDTPVGSKVRVHGESRRVTPLMKRRANFAKNVRR